jgi:hypothetical protein
VIASDPLDWKRRVCLNGCVVHHNGGCEGPLQAHHVISQQALRRRGLDRELWNVRNGVAVCEQAHRRHTLAVERICYDDLPYAAFQFANEHGLAWMIDRYYPRRTAA